MPNLIHSIRISKTRTWSCLQNGPIRSRNTTHVKKTGALKQDEVQTVLFNDQVRTAQ